MTHRLIAVLSLAVTLNGCATVRSVLPGSDPKPIDPLEETRRAREEAHARIKPSPAGVTAGSPTGLKVLDKANKDRSLRVLVSTVERTLWLMRDTTVLFAAPVAVGMQESFTWAGKTYDFKTPHSQRKVMLKQELPVWVPPDWHYFEKAAEQNLKPVALKKNKDVVRLADSTRIEVRGIEVGRVNQFGNFWPFTPGAEIIFEGRIFIPPIGTAQRKVPDVLGTHKLEIGDGYMIHGTNQETSIGEAVSHGCVRMYNQDVAELYSMVPMGTAVYIF